MKPIASSTGATRQLRSEGCRVVIKAALHDSCRTAACRSCALHFRETQELVFDAHDKAFVFYGGVCRRGIYDTVKTAVEAIFVGKARQYNRRFLADVSASFWSSRRLYTCRGMGEGSGREPGRQSARPVFPSCRGYRA